MQLFVVEEQEKIKVKFFEHNFVEAIESGIYGIYIEKNKTKKLLYVGESVFILVRCATYLYEIAKGKGYLGFTKEILNDNDITLIFGDILAYFNSNIIYLRHCSD